MRRFIFALIAAMALCTLAQGNNRTITEKDSLGNKKRVIELRDTFVDGKAVVDTLSVMSYENGASTDESDNSEDQVNNRDYGFSGLDFNEHIGPATMIVSIVSIVFVFGLPVIIVFLVFFFRYKNRKAKYRLVEQALASGQPLPESIFKEAAQITDTRTKGIKNTFLGIGLFIFFWAITGEFGVACIGLLIMFTGLGQIVIHYTQQDTKRKPFKSTDNEEK